MDERDWAGLAGACREQDSMFTAMFSGQDAIDGRDWAGLSGALCECKSGCSFWPGLSGDNAIEGRDSTGLPGAPCERG